MIRGCSSTPPTTEQDCFEGSSRNGKFKVFSFFETFKLELTLIFDWNRIAKWPVTRVYLETVAITIWTLFRISSLNWSTWTTVTHVSCMKTWMAVWMETKTVPSSNSAVPTLPAPWSVRDTPMLHATRPRRFTLITLKLQTVSSSDSKLIKAKKENFETHLQVILILRFKL